ncbi:PP-loop domain protein [Ruminiclostridium papyrosolvens DSM 2782]|uniref:PP-loop domain protein n=1 Tax=Ruminiclostridium papyrosolvens DSM 2782 TaxID=588581 RepID=F1TAZ0_9FIRM|nr:tRNA 2-thiocytidine(32) synthetase TtcA [Ruminiclostridium papyrosolvens]EGD48194.1 PP-loop domain protein [Ruminiclostridium papyrosolvens DSM 2782]WES34295.1 tRNA 2-thiocytidine(32) synthetase TtcA [Ruminiclostridium papyrosolvens DSM 2782]
MVSIQRILGQVRRAIQDYNMIEDGDKIAVGVSGGKDSMTLLTALRQLQNFYPKKFELEAISLTMGIGNADYTPVVEYCKQIGVNYSVEETLIGKIIFEVRNEKNPCSMCANLRRGALHNKAKKLGCNKVALGHHRDDAVETLLLSSFYEGRIHTFSPVTYLDRQDLYLIRPLIYTEEKQIKAVVKSESLPIVKSPCHVDGKTKRQYIKDLILELQKDNREIKSNLFGAIKRAEIDGWHE